MLSNCTVNIMHRDVNKSKSEVRLTAQYPIPLQRCKLSLARTPEAGKFHCGQVRHLKLHTRPASREYTHEK